MNGHSPIVLRYILLSAAFGLVNGILALWTIFLCLRLRPIQPGISVAVIRNGNIGDHMAAIPAYRAIHMAIGKAPMALVTLAGTNRGYGREFLDREGLFHRIVEVPAGVRARRGLELMRLVKALKCDYVVYLPSDKVGVRQVAWHALIVRLAGIRSGGVFRISKLRLFRRWQVRTLSFPSETERLLELVRMLGIRPDPECLKTVKVEAISLNLPDPVVAICPGGEVAVNHWPEERYAELCRRLIQNRGWSVVMLGGAGDRKAADIITASLPNSHVRDLTGRTSLLEAAGLLRGCVCLVSNDTSLGHLAATVGTPVLTIFSSRDFPNSWLPHGQNIGLRHSVSCEVCFRRTCPTMHCIRGIEVSDVLQAVDHLLHKAQRQVIAV